jgi:epoxyqueuosine reductase QueG
VNTVCLVVCSMDAYKALQDKDARAKALQARRQQLSDMLAEENEQFRVSFPQVVFFI